MAVAPPPNTVRGISPIEMSGFTPGQKSSHINTGIPSLLTSTNQSIPLTPDQMNTPFSVLNKPPAAAPPANPTSPFSAITDLINQLNSAQPNVPNSNLAGPTQAGPALNFGGTDWFSGAMGSAMNFNGPQQQNFLNSPSDLSQFAGY
jgi:hypothetical protein